MIRQLFFSLVLAIDISARMASAANPADDLDQLRTVLAKMPLPSTTGVLQRTNILRHLLQAFQSNAVVKGIVVLPGVADDLYLINRDQRPLDIHASNVNDALTLLTNRSTLRIIFRPPFLLIHSSLTGAPGLTRPLLSQESVKLDTIQVIPKIQCWDMHWRLVQPAVERATRMKIRPSPDAGEAWHFERANLSGFGLTGAELVTAVALSTGTELHVRGRRLLFERTVAP